nr:hypothetical protein [uncultured Sphingomonas sp.]
MVDPASRYSPSKPAFGAWLLQQTKADGWVRNFALAASADRSFPRAGDPEAVRQWLSSKRASGDDWAALEDAENDYLCY